MSATNLEKSVNLLDMLEKSQQNGATSEEVATAMKRYVEAKARARFVPMRGTLELTPLCNLDCKMCYVHLNKDQYERENTKVLSGTQWISIISQAIEAGLLEVTLTGGEALLHPDFDDILLFLEANDVYVNLKSNGLLLSDERLAFLKKHHLSNIQISLYGSNEDSFEKVTGHRGFSETIAAIQRVQKIGIPLEVVITPSVYMWDDIEDLLKLVENLGVQYSVNPGLVDPLIETGRSGQEHDLSLDQYITLSKMRLSLKGENLTPICSDEIPLPGGRSNMKMPGVRCAAGRSVFTVTWRGKLLPCRMMEWIGSDLLSASFIDGWKQINTSVANYPYPQECVECEFEGLCPTCVIQHQSGAPVGHANPTICNRTRRMMAEGIYTRISAEKQ